MQRITSLVGREVKWVQPRAMKRNFELRDGEDVAAALSFQGRFGSLGVAESADGSWTFKRAGFWRKRVTIRPADSETELAVFTNSTWSGGGSLALGDGRQWRANTNLWITKYEIKDENGTLLVRFRKIGGPHHLSWRVEGQPERQKTKGRPWP